MRNPLIIAAMLMAFAASGAVAEERGPLSDDTTVPTVVALEADSAAEPTVVAPEEASASSWQDVVLTIVSTVSMALITTLLVPWLRAKSQQAASEGQSSKLKLAQSLALMVAANYAERRLPAIAQIVIDRRRNGGALSRDFVKSLLYQMGVEAKEELKAALTSHGIDWAFELGHDGLARLLRWAADRVSPFPGKETAVELLGKGGETLLEKGVSWLRDNVLNDTVEEAVGTAAESRPMDGSTSGTADVSRIEDHG